MQYLQFKDQRYYITDNEAKIFDTLTIPEKVETAFSESIEVKQKDVDALLELAKICTSDHKDGLEGAVVKLMRKYYVEQFEIPNTIIEIESYPSIDRIIIIWTHVLNLKSNSVVFSRHIFLNHTNIIKNKYLPCIDIKHQIRGTQLLEVKL